MISKTYRLDLSCVSIGSGFPSLQPTMRSFSSPIHIFWFAALLAFTFLFLALASTDQVLGGEESRVATGRSLSERILPQRRLAGPGSSPPSCVSKCGSCTPCEPVADRKPPVGTLSTDYDPQVWRCKCGDKIFKP